MRDNLRAIARCLDRKVEDLVVIVLDRPRHRQLIADIREAGARIRLIGDGDLSAGISAAVRGSGVHAVMGTGGAPEGVLVAAAMRCLNGEILARLVVDTPEKEERCRSMGIADMDRVYRAADLACGRRIIFAATGVTDGTLMKGVRFFGDGARTNSLVMQTSPQRIQFVGHHPSDRRLRHGGAFLTGRGTGRGAISRPGRRLRRRETQSVDSGRPLCLRSRKGRLVLSGWGPPRWRAGGPEVGTRAWWDGKAWPAR